MPAKNNTDNPKNEHGLNIKQMTFIDLLMEGNTITESYKNAGYHPANDNSACASGSELLRNPKIIAEINDRFESHKKRVSMLTGKATDSLAKILRIDADDNPQILNLQRQIAESILDRAGLAAKQVITHEGSTKEPLRIILEDDKGNKVTPSPGKSVKE